MGEIRGIKGRLASIRQRYRDSKEGLETNLNMTRETERLTHEARQLIGQAGELLVQASVIQATGVKAIRSGNGRIMGLALDVENVYQGSGRYEEMTERANGYQGAYSNVMDRSNQALTDSQRVLGAVKELHVMLGAYGKQMLDIMTQSSPLIEESSAIESAIHNMEP